MFHDPTIPQKHVQGNAGEKYWRPGPAIGRLHKIGDKLILVDHRANEWTEDEAQLVFGAFGRDTEGGQKAPRPWRYDATGAVLEQGDEFVIDFIDGDHRQPFIRGGVQSTIRNTPDGFFVGDPLSEDPNRLRFRLEQRDGSGNATRHFDVEVFASDGQAELRVSGSDPSGDKVRVLLDFATGSINVGEGGESERIIRAQAFLADLATELQAVATALAGVPAPVPTLVTFATELTTQASAGQGSYLSPTIKID